MRHPRPFTVGLLVGAALFAQAPPADTLPLKPERSCCAASTQSASRYRVPLTADEEQRAQAVYRRSIVITAHDHCFHRDDFADMEAGGITVRTIKLTVDGIYWKDGARAEIASEIAGWPERGERAIRLLEEQAAASGGKIVIVRSVADIRKVKRERTLGVILGFEGGRPLGGRIENLGRFHQRGLRDLQLYWAVSSPLRNRDSTLTAFGLEVVREANRLGIVLDLSHMRKAAFEQVMQTTGHPVLISHCGVAAVSGLKPGGTDFLDDETIRAVARGGGVICLHFYDGYIRPRHGPRATVEDWVDHADYIKRLVGISHVAMGVDFFPERGYGWIEGAGNLREIPNIARELVRRGYQDEEIRKVLGGNLMRVYQKVWGK